LDTASRPIQSGSKSTLHSTGAYFQPGDHGYVELRRKIAEVVKNRFALDELNAFQDMGMTAEDGVGARLDRSFCHIQLIINDHEFSALILQQFDPENAVFCTSSPQLSKT
jgi:hypothetical protein